MSNVKVGDLALIIRAGDPRVAANIGRLVDVIAPHVGQRIDGGNYSPPEGLEWVIRSTGLPFATGVKPSMLHVAADTSLRPIRPQPDDARDEMLRPLPTSINTKEYV